MTARAQCDVLVCGLSLGGLIAANLLQKRGQKVIVVRDDNEDTPRIITEPSLFVGFEKGGLYETILSELGVSLSFLKGEGALIEPLSPCLQIILPDRRINLFTPREDFLYEVTREFHIKEQEIKAFYTEMDRLYALVAPYFYPPSPICLTTLQEQRSTLEKIQYLWTFYVNMRRKGDFYPLKYLGDCALIECLDLLVLCFSKLRLCETSSLTLIILLGLLGKEVVQIRGGISRLVDFLLHTFLSHGGEVHSHSRVTDILVKSNKVQSVEWERKEKIECGSLILSLPEHSSRRFASLYFGIDRGVLPPLMKENILLCTDNADPPFGGNALFISFSGMQEMRVRCLVEKESQQEGYYGERVRKKAMEAIRWLIPFSSGKIIFLGDDLSRTAPQNVVYGHLWERVARVEKGGSLYFRSRRATNVFILPDQNNYIIGGVKEAAAGIELSNALSP